MTSSDTEQSRRNDIARLKERVRTLQQTIADNAAEVAAAHALRAQRDDAVRRAEAAEQRAVGLEAEIARHKQRAAASAANRADGAQYLDALRAEKQALQAQNRELTERINALSKYHRRR